jgi:hypothetical protein
VNQHGGAGSGGLCGDRPNENRCEANKENRCIGKRTDLARFGKGFRNAGDAESAPLVCKQTAT